MDPLDAPSQFYRGLVAELYDPLVSFHARADDYVPFLERWGTPSLELACGSGRPLLDLVERGHEVEGLDASQDMLRLCRARAEARGLDVTLHLAEMQSFDVSRRYRSIFLAGASFTLLTTDGDAERALERIHTHLQPGGAACIPIEAGNVEAVRRSIGRPREVRSKAGETLRVATVALEVSADGRSLSQRLRYERITRRGGTQRVERDWRTRWWSQAHFMDMLHRAGFEEVTLLRPEGGRARPEESSFTALVRRGAG